MNNPAQSSSTSTPPPLGRNKRVDAHHHLWQYSSHGFEWINEEMGPLRRDFLIHDLRPLLHAAKVEATVVVQARETLEESRWLLACAHSSPVIAGVVGWAPLEESNLPTILAGLNGGGKLVGLREILQHQPPGYLDRDNFNRGIEHLTTINLTYDILIHQGQLTETIRFVDRHPYQQFVLDHAAKPRIASGEIEPWRSNLLELARRPNVVCKVSGLTTEAQWTKWTLDSLRPYLDVCVEAFGPGRLIAGSDWPVCLLATNYSRWWDILADYFRSFSSYDIDQVFCGNAIRVYRLPSSDEAQP